MPDETQVSGEVPVAVADNPAPAETGAQKGSDGTVPAQEHRDIGSLLQSLSPTERRQLLQNLPPDELLEHPGVKQRMHSFAQSQADRAANQVRTQLNAQWQTAEQRKRVLTADPLELGEEVKQRTQREIELEPIIEQTRRQTWEQSYTQGYQSAYAEIARDLEEVRDELKLGKDEFASLVNSSPKFGKLVVGMIHHGVDRKAREQVEAERAKLRDRQETEQRAEGRAREPSPDLGEGAASGTDSDFLSEFAAGRSSDFGRAKKLLGI